MSDTERAAQIMDELSTALREAGESGKAYERIDELVAACERAACEVGGIVRR